MEKVVLPRKVAEAIEMLREIGVSNFYIVNYVGGRQPIGRTGLTPHLRIIDEWLTEDVTNRDALLAALVNGYTVEKPPEERLRDYYRMASEESESSDYDVFPYARERAAAILETLDILGIKIDGINGD